MTDTRTAELEISGVLQSIVHAAQLDVRFTVQSIPGAVPEMTILFQGPEVGRLTARSGELLLAIEHVVAKIRGLDSEQHDLLFVDADGFKERRNGALLKSAHEAAEQVKKTGMPYVFGPMSSHERRLLHLALTPTGLHSESQGAGMNRAVVVYPAQPRARQTTMS
jgi:spoIIIJ-associated protein